MTCDLTWLDLQRNELVRSCDLTCKEMTCDLTWLAKKWLVTWLDLQRNDLWLDLTWLAKKWLVRSWLDLLRNDLWCDLQRLDLFTTHTCNTLTKLNVLLLSVSGTSWNNLTCSLDQRRHHICAVQRNHQAQLYEKSQRRGAPSAKAAVTQGGFDHRLWCLLPRLSQQLNKGGLIWLPSLKRYGRKNQALPL